MYNNVYHLFWECPLNRQINLTAFSSFNFMTWIQMIGNPRCHLCLVNFYSMHATRCSKTCQEINCDVYFFLVSFAKIYSETDNNTLPSGIAREEPKLEDSPTNQTVFFLITTPFKQNWSMCIISQLRYFLTAKLTLTDR